MRIPKRGRGIGHGFLFLVQRTKSIYQYNTESKYTVLPEIFARVLFWLNFAVGVGPRKLSARNFLRTRKF